MFGAIVARSLLWVCGVRDIRAMLPDLKRMTHGVDDDCPTPCHEHTHLPRPEKCHDAPPPLKPLRHAPVAV